MNARLTPLSDVESSLASPFFSVSYLDYVGPFPFPPSQEADGSYASIGPSP